MDGVDPTNGKPLPTQRDVIDALDNLARATSSNQDNTQAELREQVNRLLDFFTEPGEGNKYLKDLENDLLQLITSHTNKAIAEADRATLETIGSLLGGKDTAEQKLAAIHAYVWNKLELKATKDAA